MAVSARRSLKWVAIVIYISVVVCGVNAGLTLYISKKFAENQLGLAVRNDIFLIEDGKKNRAFDNRMLFKETTKAETTKAVSPSVKRVEMTWFAAKHSVNYSLQVLSSDPHIMRTPQISPIPLEGTINHDDSHQTFEITLPCSGLAEGPVDVRFVLNYTYYRRAIGRFATKTLQFWVAKQCKGPWPTEKSTVSTLRKNVDRTAVVTACAATAFVICVVVGVIFFWRFVKRIRRKFGFDEVTDRLPTRTEVARQSLNRSTSQLPTVVYSPKRDRSLNTFFSKIAKRDEPRSNQTCSTRDNADHATRVRCGQESRGDNAVDGSKPFITQFSSCDSRSLKLFSQVSVVDDDVFVSETCDVSLIENEQPPSTLTVAKEADNENEMYSTLNEYWAAKLDGSLKSREDVEIRSEILGEGLFGRVHRGKLRPPGYDNTQYVDVAVKVCLDDIEFEQMVACVNEAILMKRLDHKNLLELVGVVLQPVSPPIVLTPFLAHGDLHKFLRHSRGIGIRRQLIGSRQLVNFGTQIARGMQYLASQKVVHRDLAARNCFVDGELNVKIGDLGLARDVNQLTDLYKMEQPTRLAVKWLALESLLYYVFNEKSDVWSFGIVLWELVTLGAQPYAGLDNYEVTPYLETGKRLSRPLRCPDDLYAIMLSCWSASPEDRPSFTILVHKLEDYEQRLRPSCIAFEFDEDTIEMADDCDYF